MNTGMRSMVAVCFAAVLMGCVVSCEDSNSSDSGVQVDWSGFAWGASGNDSTVTEFSVSAKVGQTLYYTISIIDMDVNRVYTNRTTIAGNGTVIFDSTQDLRPEDPTWNAWVSHTVAAGDPPGTWTFTHYLDGKKVAEGSVTAKP